MLKTCTRCKRTLDKSEFHRNQSKKDGRDYRCRDCYAFRRKGRPRREPQFWTETDGRPMRRCSRCALVFEATVENFSPRSSPTKGASDGCNSFCRKCQSAASMASAKKYDPTFKRVKSWVAKNRARHNANAKAARDRRKADPARSDKHRAWLRDYERKRRASDPKRRFLDSVRSRIHQIVSGKIAGVGLLRRLGYTRDELMRHIERQFTRGMSWESYGRNGWHIDHVLAADQFDLSTEEGFRAYWALPNLRPLWEKDNCAKGARRIFLV